MAINYGDFSFYGETIPGLSNEKKCNALPEIACSFFSALSKAPIFLLSEQALSGLEIAIFIEGPLWNHSSITTDRRRRIFSQGE